MIIGHTKIKVGGYFIAAIVKVGGRIILIAEEYQLPGTQPPRDTFLHRDTDTGPRLHQVVTTAPERPGLSLYLMFTCPDAPGAWPWSLRSSADCPGVSGNKGI